MIVTPIPGAHRATVLQTLRAVHTAATNLGNYHRPDQNILKYLTWGTESVRKLSSHIRPQDVEALVRTPVYWAVLAGAGQIGGKLEAALANGILDLEVRQRVDVLEQAVAVFEAQMMHWPPNLSVLVLDTSFFIEHPEKFDETDYTGLHEGEGALRIVVPMAVVDELDQLKEAKVSAQKRWRARHGLAVLERLLEEKASLGDVAVEVLPDPAGHVRLPDVDDEIVDRALALTSLAAGPVRLVTYDTGMALRAKVAGVPVRKLRQELGSEPERDKK